MLSSNILIELSTGQTQNYYRRLGPERIRLELAAELELTLDSRTFSDLS